MGYIKMQKAQLIITVLKQKLETYCQFSLKAYLFTV